MKKGKRRRNVPKMNLKLSIYESKNRETGKIYYTPPGYCWLQQDFWVLCYEYPPYNLWSYESYNLYGTFARMPSKSPLRDDWKFQNGCFFGKVPNGLWPPPPSFSENYIADFPTKMRQKCVCSLWRECYNINVLYDPISHEMHVVQQFNMVIGWKTYPEMTLL